MEGKQANLNFLALTSCCVDYYPQIDKSFMGGNSLNVASMWKRLAPDSNVSVITCLGNDANGKMITDYFKSIGIDISRIYVKEGRTASNKLRVDENGERYGIEGSWDGGVYDSFALSGSDWEWVYQQDIVAMPGNNLNFPEMLQRKHPNQLLSVDYLDVENHIPLEETLDFTDISFITAKTGLLPKYRDLAFSRKKLVVVTLGDQGSYAYHNEETFYQPALPVPKVVDTTGCGDAYQAAFALTYFKTRDIQKSMFAGANAAAQILQAWGGVGNIAI
jgi:fructoselysine 6-kinase